MRVGDVLHVGLLRKPTKISRSKRSSGPCGPGLRSYRLLQCRQRDNSSLYLLAPSSYLYALSDGAPAVSLSGLWRACSFMLCDYGAQYLTSFHSAASCHFNSHESSVCPTPTGGRHTHGVVKGSTWNATFRQLHLLSSSLVVHLAWRRLRLTLWARRLQIVRILSW